jgi:hypothetical protein
MVMAGGCDASATDTGGPAQMNERRMAAIRFTSVQRIELPS